MYLQTLVYSTTVAGPKVQVVGRTTATCMFAGLLVPARVLLGPRLVGSQRRGAGLTGAAEREARRIMKDGDSLLGGFSGVGR